ncbi:helix-turn-helix domain-containing protein [Streptosporangium saharense]|uniref:helix-turn-helix domain-containing protein n=1 Tax=Streptosporangium saharense TaxID=1706840 RepID=UPI0036958534
MVTKSPTVRHRRLGRELRQSREAAGLTPEIAGRQLGWSRSKISRIETARLLPTITDVGHACDLYGLNREKKAGLIQLTKEAGQRGWWTAYDDVFTTAFVGLEAESVAIRAWEPLLIPGLLQSEGYARGLMSAPGNLDEAELKRRVDARMQRKIVLHRPSAPSLHAVVDEPALRRPAAPGIMARQLDDLLQVADWPHVTIQVLPLSAGQHIGLDGAFTLFSFGEEDPEVGYIGGPGGNLYVEAPARVRDLRLTFERLADQALSPEQSAALIAAVRSEHDLP